MAFSSSSCCINHNQYDDRPISFQRRLDGSFYSLSVHEKGAKQNELDESESKRGTKKRKKRDESSSRRRLQSQAVATTTNLLQKEEEQPPMVVPTVGFEETPPPPPPYIVVVQGPSKVGKSLLIRSLIKFYTKQQQPDDVEGPVTIILGELRRIQFVECPNNINGMIDAAKYADLVLLLVDAHLGFDMATFEFLSLLQVHGCPNVAGVLTHFDKFRDEEKLNEARERLGHQFLKEIYKGAELFYMSQLDNGMYDDCEIHKLAAYISTVEFYPLSWRESQPYMLVDRIDRKCDRDVFLYGYLRGCYMKRGTKVHIAGVGDFLINGITSLADPCSSQSAAEMKGSVSSKERLFYVPMSDLESLVYGKCTDYIETPKHSVLLLPNVDENEKAVQKGKECDDVTRLEMEGFRRGTYVRLEIHDVAENFDPCHPILVGGISLEEGKVGYLQARLKRHSWRRKVLMSGDPVVVSVGWRRYETKPIYAKEHGGNRFNRMLHFTPRDTFCLAMFWGPLAASTGLVAVHNVAENEGVYRILATGVVLDPSKAAIIVEKTERVGAPCKILKKTALVEDMFSSDHEIDRCKGAAVKTTKGVRGKIIKAATREGDQLTEGIAKCLFKSEISMSDQVVMPMLKQVEVPRVFNQFPSADKDALNKLSFDCFHSCSSRLESPERRRVVVFVDEPPSSWTGSKPYKGQMKRNWAKNLFKLSKEALEAARRDQRWKTDSKELEGK